MKFIFILFLTFVLTSFLVPFLINYLVLKKLLDQPGPRKIHAYGIPRLGGAVIFFTALLVIAIFYPDFSKAFPLLFAGLILFILGIIDDLKSIRWKIKLFFQIIAVTITVLFFKNFSNNIYLFGALLPPIIGIPLFFFFILGTINSINLMDGLDGLVSGFSLIVFSVIFLLSYLLKNQLLMVLSVTMVGALLGFLKFNSNPAKIFLGDSGSLFLGYSLVASSIYLSIMKYGYLELAPPIMLLALPIIDTLKVMVLRIVHKKSPFLPDKNHLHHIIFGKNIRHKIVVFLIL